MGFRIRKSINLFPGFKLNLSKKGLGWSAGIKGVRLNSRSQYNLGTGPLTYQGSLNKKSKNNGIVYLFIFAIIIYILMK